MFVGRKRHLQDLNQLMRKRSSSLVTCRGRRRIGKSRLIREFGQSAPIYLEFEGLAPRADLCNADQLEAFSQQLARQTILPKVALDNWPQAFQLLSSIITDEWTVILLDEVSWLGGYDPDFPGHLKKAWDALNEQHSKLILIVCGSISAWIEENILQNTGFVGRTSWDIHLEELSLASSDLFWGKNRDKIDTSEKLTVLSVTGGIPKYLEEIDPGLSADENIQRLCFYPEGILFREFDQIFSDIFGKRSKSYREILHSLTAGSRSVSEISHAIGKQRSGHMTAYLKDLMLAGFIAKDKSFDPKSGRVTRTEKYRLKDNYSRFFLKYVEPQRDRIEKGLVRSQVSAQLPGWNSLLGLQFENLVLGNVDTLTKLMGIGGTPVLSASPYFQKPTARKKGCQIDLMIVTKHSLYVVEIKRRLKIGMAVVEEVQQKVNRISTVAGKSIRTVLVYEGELTAGVKNEGYFDFIIPFGILMRHPE